MSNYQSTDIRRLSAIFSALSNPHRLRIFIRLASCYSKGTNGTADDQICACVGSLGKDLGISLPTVSHHIKELYRAGLIEMRRHGTTIECSVDPETVDLLAEFFKLPAHV
jgi:ArsR family transcriptional regulator